MKALVTAYNDNTHRPSLISSVIDRDTTSREARSLATGAYRSMNRSPSLFRRYPPSPRQPSVIKQPAPYMPTTRVTVQATDETTSGQVCHSHTSGVKLHKLHVLVAQTSSGYHSRSISSARVSRGTREIGTTITTVGADSRLDLQLLQSHQWRHCYTTTVGYAHVHDVTKTSTHPSN